jgi:hypothetical protein
MVTVGVVVVVVVVVAVVVGDVVVGDVVVGVVVVIVVGVGLVDVVADGSVVRSSPSSPMLVSSEFLSDPPHPASVNASNTGQ